MIIKLGDQVRDVITGFKGIAVSRCTYLNGCDHIGIQPKASKDGALPPMEWIDLPQVEIIKAKRVSNKPREKKLGGPGGHPSRRRHP